MERNRQSMETQTLMMANSNDLHEVPIFESNALMVGGARLMLKGMRIEGEDALHIPSENSQRHRCEATFLWKLGKKIGVSGKDYGEVVIQKLTEMESREEK
ncbi:hypothetical protein VNO78_17808 [Psophocarpus tetragonolobus]|uniref:Uncharacterized protein n=1 Tax=Psophocarpus tetragonolobus TaxID=3891 RepID=A0AAN9SN91_PSOTE